MISTSRRTFFPAKRYHAKPAPSQSVRRVPDWEAAGLAGLLGGLTFVALEMVFTGLSSGGMWDAPRLAASVVFGGTLPAEISNGFLLMLALAVHFTLSLVYARALALHLTFHRSGPPVLVGAAFGLLLYFVNLHGVALAVPRLAALQGLPLLLIHCVYGAVVAVAYRRLERLGYE